MYINYNYCYNSSNKELDVTTEPLYGVSKTALMFIRDSAGFGSGTARVSVCVEALELLQEPGMNQVKKFLAETGFPLLNDHYLIELAKTLEHVAA